jgi:predicted PurR-regulated permease PerM
VIATIARSIFLLFMTLMVAGYIMGTRETIIGFFRSLLPSRSRTSYDRLLWRVDRGLSGVVRGQLLICLVNGVLSAFGYWMFDLKYWPILALVSGIMSIVPIFGSILSSIPVVMIGLTQNFWTALWVLLWIIGIHQVEANLLNPKIIGVAAKIHPVLVVLALITGEHFFGLWGALLAVPVLSILQSIFIHFRFETMPDAPPDSLLPPVGGARI